MGSVYHISTLTPDEFVGGAIRPHENDTINGDRVNAVFAYDVPAGPDNPYAARDGRVGMVCAGDIVIYNDDNIDHKDGKLFLKKPLYQYEIDDAGFEQVKQSELNVEYILKDKSVNVADTKCTKIEDVSYLCDTHQVFSDVSGKGIAFRCLDLAKKFGPDRAMGYLQSCIDNGDVVYHNEYMGTNVNPDFMKRERELPVVDYANVNKDSLNYNI